MSEKTTEQFLKEIDDLKKAHPEFEIKFSIDCQCLDDDQKIYSVKITKWFETDSSIFTDEDDILDFFIEQVADEYYGFSNARIEALAKARYNEAQIKDVICVYFSN